MRPTRVYVTFLTLMLVSLLGRSVASAQTDDRNPTLDWRAEWGVADSLALDPDTEGYRLPTAIAFVPHPGAGPKDPLYFVTELRGTVKVVTNDRSVYTFAENLIQSRPLKELPEFAGETGLAGICLAPEQGYVFVTFAYRDTSVTDSAGSTPPHLASNRATAVRREGGILRNSMVRFRTTPGTFSLRPDAQVSFRELFAGYEVAISHQIGGCQVLGDMLYVSVADGYQTAESQQVNSLLGKVLRMTLDGRPAPRNPFLRALDGQGPGQFVWAYGFRNPFGLKVIGNRVFVADNGMRIDRFLEARAGENYLWNGDDWSIGARADLFFYPDVGPAQLDYYRDGSVLPQQYNESFIVAASNPDRPGILRLGYSLEQGHARDVPEYILRYQGSGTQIVTGVALGSDGLYFVPTLPDGQGRSAVFRLSYRPDQPHPVHLTSAADPETVMEERGCFGCHQIAGAGGAMGPPLDQQALVKRVETRLASNEYVRSVRELDAVDQEPFRRFREARAQVLRASGQDKVRTWMIYRLIEPKFDNPAAQMPNLGLSNTEAALLTDHLLREVPAAERWRDAVLQALPAALRPEPLMYRHLALAFGGGLLVSAVIFAVVPRALRRVRRKRALPAA